MPAGHGLRAQQAGRRGGGAALPRSAVDHRAAGRRLRPARPGAAPAVPDRPPRASPRSSGWGGRRSRSSSWRTSRRRSCARRSEPRALGQTYHVAHPTPVTQRELATGGGARGARRPRSARCVPVPPLVAAPIVRAIGRAAAASGRRSVVNADKLAEFLAPSWAASVEKAERELGWRASRELASGLDATAAWYRAEGWLS